MFRHVPARRMVMAVSAWGIKEEGPLFGSQAISEHDRSAGVSQTNASGHNHEPLLPHEHRAQVSLRYSMLSRARSGETGQ